MVNMIVGYGAYAIVYPNSEEFSQQVIYSIIILTNTI